MLRQDADFIISSSLAAVQPDRAVTQCLSSARFSGRVVLVAVGKAAWTMANAALSCLETPIDRGVVISKYGHIPAPLPGCQCFEAGHPVPDENSLTATAAAMAAVRDLTAQDTVLFLLSGGGSALFEQTPLPLAQLQDITRQLLACGADIGQINTIRKHLSSVKGGKFAALCQPASVVSIVLSDVLGDRLDMIASGPVAPDETTCQEALDIFRKYGLTLSEEALALLRQETPKVLPNVTSHVVGSVRILCQAAADACRTLGYTPEILTDSLDCQARDAGQWLGSMAKAHLHSGKAFVAGGETVVKLTGTGLGGRNQELALAAAPQLEGLEDVALFSLGSDGTDGPTDAAGGYVDGSTAGRLAALGISIPEVLRNNDAYHALQAVDGLLLTGPTGTNVNDVAVLLCRSPEP